MTPDASCRSAASAPRPSRRRAVALAAAVALAGLLAACTAQLVADLDDRQSREVMAALGRAGIPAEREPAGEGKFAISVASGDASRAMAVLEAEALPRPKEEGLASLYSSASMIPTPSEEKARYIAALSSEIAGHLRKLQGVLDASVIITAPEKDPLAPPDQPVPRPTASVLVRVPAEGPAPDDADVRKLVAGAVEGMTPEDVAVVFTRAPPPPPDTGAPSYAKVGPFAVAAGSKAPLQIALGLALLLIIGLGAWAFVGERRRAELRRRIEALEAAANA
ncbi:MAG: hypothetical protein D6689_19235 [Deltaproteobacteria bacterium]|nr:MAG: hypothetical protein D6689_19235 [Deltaproteobacteria bacterium]